MLSGWTFWYLLLVTLPHPTPWEPGLSDCVAGTLPTEPHAQHISRCFVENQAGCFLLLPSLAPVWIWTED